MNTILRINKENTKWLKHIKIFMDLTSPFLGYQSYILRWIPISLACNKNQSTYKYVKLGKHDSFSSMKIEDLVQCHWKIFLIYKNKDNYARNLPEEKKMVYLKDSYMDEIMVNHDSNSSSLAMVVLGILKLKLNASIMRDIKRMVIYIIIIQTLNVLMYLS